MAPTGCIPDQDLRAFLLGELPPRLADAVARHLEGCPDCEARAGRWDNLADFAIQALRRADPGRTAATRTAPSDDTPPGGTDRAALAPGTTPVPPGFTLLEELGRGAVGVVYKARQHQPERVVALKWLLGGAHGGAEQRARFRAEGDAIARLNHPHIVRVHAVGEHQGQPFLCLEYVGGGTLGQQIAGRPQPPAEAARLLELLAGAVQHAHEQGVIHRDLKPANILLQIDLTQRRQGAKEDQNPKIEAENRSASGAFPASSSDLCALASLREAIPKISDFGLARFGRPELTATGQIMGTPSYTAPEQARGENERVGPAADIWALGAILYELLTGQPPFRGVQALDTLKQVVEQEPVAPARLQPGVPRDLNVICLKCLEKTPAKRYATAGELAQDLGRFRSGRPIHARPAGPGERAWRWCRHKPALAAFAFLAGLGLVATVGLSVAFALYQRQANADLNEALARARQERRQADTQAALANLERALVLWEKGAADQALLLLASDLELAERADRPDLAASVRCLLDSWGRQCHSLQGYLPHEADIRAVAFSPDGRWAVTGSAGGSARLWEVATGERRATLEHPGPVTAVAFGQGGKVLLTAGVRTARLWEASSGKALSPPLQHPEPIHTAAFSPDGSQVLTSGRAARLWDSASGTYREFRCDDHGSVRTAIFSPDGRRLAGGSADGTVCLWEASTGKRVFALAGHKQAALALAFSPDGSRLLSGGEDGRAILWDAVTGRRVGTPFKHSAAVAAVAFSTDGRSLATGSRDWKARLWPAAAGLSGTPLELRHEAPVTSLAFSPDGRTLLTGSRDGKARLWEVATGKLLAQPLPHQGEVFAVAFHPDGRTVLTAGQEPAARLWRAARQDYHAFAHPKWDDALAFNPDRRYLAIGGYGGFARLWDLTTGRPAGQPMPHDNDVKAVVFSHDGKFLVTAGADGAARFWDVPTGRPRLSPPVFLHRDRLGSLALSPDDKLLLAGGRGRVYLWRVDTGERLAVLTGHSGPVSAVAFSPDGRTFLTGGEDFTARLWRTATRQPIGPPLRHLGQVWAVAFRPDGRVAVTGSGDKTVRFWDTATGRPHGAPLQQPWPVGCLAFSADGQLLLVGGSSYSSRLWDLGRRLPLAVPPRHQEELVRAVAFSRDGQRLLTAGDDMTAHFSPVPAPLAGSPERLALWAQVRTGLELDEAGTVRMLDAAAWHDRRRRLEQRGGPR
jgi:WD40 repeat protein/serine/threonine protein kinase